MEKCSDPTSTGSIPVFSASFSSHQLKQSVWEEKMDREKRVKSWRERNEERGVKSNEEGEVRGVSRGHVASPCTCSLRCREADCIAKAPA